MQKWLSLTAKKFTGPIDALNDKVTSYRLVLYFLIALVGWAFLGSFFDKVPYSWDEITLSATLLLFVCWISNLAISKFLDIPANKESDLITALILCLILPPPKDSTDMAVLAAAGLTAIAGKYIITFRRSHIFNPAATGAFVAGQLFNHFPSWWVGTKFITPLVVIGGVLILRKMKRFLMVGVFLATFILYLVYGTSQGGDAHFIWLELISTQVLFFGVIMLTEPLTSPTTLSRCVPYALLVGVLYSVNKFKLSPEEALLIGNLFVFIFARNQRYKLKFLRKLKEADGIYSYAFTIPKGFKFRAGQYMEWTIAQNKSDRRGNRRYLTIASSPTEPGLMFTIKQPHPSSSFKQQLEKLKPGDSILASRLAGDFTLPQDKSKKLALLAGGIGVTPFRSMAKFLQDTKQKRDITLLYSAASADEIAFKGLFDKAGLKPHYVTKSQLDELKIKSLVPDYDERRFYISGPLGFVNAMETNLLKLGVNSSEIITDYFPGYEN
jgi:ferredoxin-NADP reductase